MAVVTKISIEIWSFRSKAIQLSNVDCFQKQGKVLGYISFPPYFNLKIQCKDVYEILFVCFG